MRLQLLIIRSRFHYKQIILAFYVTFIILTFQLAPQVDAQETPTPTSTPTATPTPKPVVRLVSVALSPVREGERLRVTVRIAPPGQAGSRIEGGILVFDSWNDAQDGPIADELIAFVFRGDVETRSMGYTAFDDTALTPDRTIRIEINRLFPDYQVDRGGRTVVEDDG